MRKGGSARLLSVVIASIAFAVPQLSHAYLDKAWLVGTEAELIQGPGTIRLAGMGNMTVAIEDENNQVNLYDFTGNVASLIFDKETHNSDTWGSYSKWADERDGVRWQDVGVWQSGTIIVLRGAGVYAGGASIATRTVDFVRVDDSLFRNGLRIAYPKSELPVPDTTMIDMETSGTSVEAYFARKAFGFGSVQRVYLGVRGWGVFEGEQRPVRLRYEVTNSANDVGAGLGILVVPSAGIQVGGTLDLGSQLVESVSQDAFHDDLYSRKRSIPSYSTQAAFSLAGKDMLRGVVNYRHYSYESDQTLLMNWSDLYVINPEEVDIHRKLKVGSEKLDSDLFATRWIFSGLGVPVRVSGYFDMATENSSYKPYPNVLVWTDEYDQSLEEWNLAGGASYELRGRALVGVEVSLNRGRLEDNNEPVPEAGLRNFKSLDVKGGGEYRVFRWLALRGGYGRCREERFMGVSAENFLSNTVSAGLGCRFKNERLSLDAAFSQRITEPEENLGFDREARYQSLMLYGRFMF